jgi:DNA ligase 1
MPSPAKKRKLNGNNNSGALPSRGLEYFFTKQRQGDASKNGDRSDASGAVPITDAPTAGQSEMTDEELARKLQAEWNQEGNREARTETPLNPSNEGEEQSNDDLKSSVEGKAAPSTVTTGKGTLSLQSVAASTDTVSETIPFDESPLTFDPSKYIAQLKESWANDGGSASYALLTRCFVLVNGTQSRIKIVDTLVNCIRLLVEADPDSLLPMVRLPVYSTRYHCMADS